MSLYSHIITTASEEQTQQFALALSACASPHDCITLTGDLGAGKTVFARAFIQALVGNVTVQSPTFMLVLPYEFHRNGQSHSLQHFDLYRIKNSSELIEIGLQEALEQSLCLIEWPEIAWSYLPAHRLDLQFTYKTETIREIRCITNENSHAPTKDHWQYKLNNI